MPRGLPKPGELLINGELRPVAAAVGLPKSDDFMGVIDELSLAARLEAANVRCFSSKSALEDICDSVSTERE